MGTTGQILWLVLRLPYGLNPSVAKPSLMDDDVRDMVAFFLPLSYDLPMKLSVSLHPPEGDNLDATNSSASNNVND